MKFCLLWSCPGRELPARPWGLECTSRKQWPRSVSQPLALGILPPLRPQWMFSLYFSVCFPGEKKILQISFSKRNRYVLNAYLFIEGAHIYHGVPVEVRGQSKGAGSPLSPCIFSDRIRWSGFATNALLLSCLTHLYVSFHKSVMLSRMNSFVQKFTK